MGTTIDLQITATSVGDLKAQLKKAYEDLGGAAAEPLNVEQLKTNNNAAKAYKREIAEKTKAAMDKKKANLERFTGQVYGWDVDENNSLIPNWDEQQKILMMREMLLHNFSYTEIARDFNKDGFVGKSGGKFTSNIISRIASNKLHERVVEFEGPDLTRYLIRKARLEQQEAGVRAKALEQGLIKSPKTKPSKKAEAKARKALNKVNPKRGRPKKVKPKKAKPIKKNSPFIKTTKGVSPVVLQKLNRRYTPLNTPFGWRRNSDGFIAPHESEQEIIAEWRTLHGQKVSYKKLASLATKSKLPTERKPDGKLKWGKVEIERILTNPINAYYSRTHLPLLKLKHLKQSPPKKKTKKAEKKAKKLKPLYTKEKLSSEVSFSLWCEENLIPIIMKEKTFVIGTRLIEAWFKATKANYGENYDQWANTHLPAIMTHVKKAFNLISKNASSYVSVQDAGDNCVLMVERPRELTTKILEKAFEGWTEIELEQ